VLHSLPGFWKVLALKRIASAMRPGGWDLDFSFKPRESEQVLEAWFAAPPAKRPQNG